MMVHKTFCKWIVGSFDRYIAFREGTFLSRVSGYFSKNQILPLLWQKSNTINLPPDSWLITLGMVPYWRLGVSPCCWKIGYSAVAIARSALETGNPCCLAHALSLSMPPWPFCLWAHWVMTKVAAEKGWVIFTKQVILSTSLLKSSSA